MSDLERLTLLNKLRKTCSQYRVIPKSMHILKGSEEVESRGYASVSRSTHEGCPVAIKVARTYTTSDPDLILSVSLPPASLHLVVKHTTEILPRGSRLEAFPASEYLAAAWSDNE